jgi:hypothetical protein
MDLKHQWGLLMVGLFEYLHIWEIMQEIELSNEDN